MVKKKVSTGNHALSEDSAWNAHERVASLHIDAMVMKWIFRIIDPSAGSPTETLLRLLLPLSNKVHSTFHPQNWRTNYADGPKYSPDCSIGRSDGRCVQRAGT